MKFLKGLWYVWRLKLWKASKFSDRPIFIYTKEEIELYPWIKKSYGYANYKMAVSIFKFKLEIIKAFRKKKTYG